ncbi:trypco2 family protein [Nonomuraea zeae]|uniref:Trypsin-co-occurring domain-containing protein n=1 Tax=Nonomuraea zeae TaxID=1642303 RepID=A0A5S4FY68_9ACTN|nr:trypco2 family protein [Nonomuraea zeae]TMR25532.1 hypothetical protein ETD85_45255 [Nonomuraea zeae]
MTNEPWIGLADAVTGIRRELQAAMQAGAGEALRFEVEEVEIDFGMELSKEAGGSAGVKVWVLEAGASASATRATTHHLTVRLKPRTAAGGPVDIADVEE